MIAIVGKLVKTEIPTINTDIFNVHDPSEVRYNYNLIFLIVFYLIVKDIVKNKPKWRKLKHKFPPMWELKSFMKSNTQIY